MKKFLCILIVFVLILSSCGKDKEATETITTTAAENIETTTQSERIPNGLPENNYNGYKFRIISRNDFDMHWPTTDVFAEAQTGEPINDAVYVRNITLSDKYGFEIVQVLSKDIMNDITKSAKSGTDTYDAQLTHIHNSSTLALNGYIVPYSDLEYVDLSKPWWDTLTCAEMSINKKNYYAMGDINTMDNDATWGFFFNKNIVKNLGLGDMYKDVENGDWTLDKMHEYCTLATSDLNGDGIVDYNDNWGLTTSLETASVFITSSNERTIVKNTEDLPEINMTSTRLIEVFGKVFDTLTDDKSIIFANNYYKEFPSDPWTAINIDMFRQGRALYICHPITSLRFLRDMENDFGILPMPKYNKEQSQYYNVLQYNNASVYSVPITNTDFKRTGFILEAMANESKYTLTKAYYDVTLQRKYTRDNESSAMLDLIFSTRILDFGFVFNWQDLQNFFANMVQKKSNTYASSYEKLIARLEKDITKTVAEFEK